MKSYLFRSFVLSLLFFALTISSCDRERPEHREAKVAVLLDLKGGQSSLGKQAMKGFLLALQKNNSDLNQNLFVSLIDTQTNPEITKSKARDVAPQVSLGTGFTNNNSILVSGKYFEEAGVPFLSIGATDPSLPKRFGGNVFLVPFGDNAQAAVAAEFAKQMFGDTVAVLWDSTSEYTITLPRYFKSSFTEFGGKVVLDSSFPGTCDISALAEKVKKLNTPPSFIYLAGLPNCIGEVVSSLRSAGVDLPIVGGDGFDTPNLLESDPSINNVWFTTHAWLSEENAISTTKQYLDAYKETYHENPNDAFAALGYDAANLLIDVLNRADSVEPQALYKALENTTNFEGVTGYISYGKDSHTPKKTVWIIEVKNGKRTLADQFIPENVPPPILD